MVCRGFSGQLSPVFGGSLKSVIGNSFEVASCSLGPRQPHHTRRRFSAIRFSIRAPTLSCSNTSPHSANNPTVGNLPAVAVVLVVLKTLRPQRPELQKPLRSSGMTVGACNQGSRRSMVLHRSAQVSTGKARETSCQGANAGLLSSQIAPESVMNFAAQLKEGARAARLMRPRFFWYAENVRQLEGANPLHNLIEVK